MDHGSRPPDPPADDDDDNCKLEQKYVEVVYFSITITNLRVFFFINLLFVPLTSARFT